MPPHPTIPQSRLEHLILELIETAQATQLQEATAIGEPDGAMITASPQTIIDSDGGRLVFIANLSPLPVFMAVGKTAIMDKGIVWQGNFADILQLGSGLFLSAVSGGGNINLAWQFFSRE